MGPPRDPSARLARGRTRASVACTACRQKRKKCVTNTGEKSCNHCKDGGLECIFRDDQRRRPNSRSYMNSLVEHIGLLESLLREVDVELPQPIQYPDPQSQAQEIQHQPETTQSQLTSWQEQGDSQENSADAAIPWLVSNDIDLQEESGLSDDDAQNDTPSSNSTSSDNTFSLHSNTVNPEQLQSTGDSMRSFLHHSTQLKYDSATGTLRYFSPVAKYQRYADRLMDSQNYSSGSWHLERRLQHMIQDIDTETLDHLMSCFWLFYNNTLQVVDQTTFQEDKDGDKLHYSRFLHVCCLAMGFRYADKSRPNIKALGRGDRRSTFYLCVQEMVETELESPRGLTTIQSLLILSDLECAVGRDRSGWMHSGTACRLAFEMGLTMDHSKSNLSRQEVEIRQRLLRACVFYDRLWAIYSGHPTVIKRSDLSLTEFSHVYSTNRIPFAESSTLQVESSLKTEEWDALFQLMELSIRVPGYIVDATSLNEFDEGTSRYMIAATLQSALESWQRHLPPHLRWNSDGIQNSSGIFLFTHQLFHSTLIQLHYSLMQSSTPQPCEPKESLLKVEKVLPFQVVSQNICLENSLRLVQIMDGYCNKFGMHLGNSFTLQPASIALTALLDNLSDPGDSVKTTTILQHIRKLINILQQLSLNYQSADKICTVVNHILPRITMGAPNTAKFELRNGAFQAMPSQSLLQPTSQRSVDSAAPSNERVSFAENDVSTDKNTINGSHSGLPRLASHGLPRQRDIDPAPSHSATTSTSIDLDNMIPNPGSMVIEKDDFLNMSNSCYISPFSIGSCNWEESVDQQLDNRVTVNEICPSIGAIFSAS